MKRELQSSATSYPGYSRSKIQNRGALWATKILWPAFFFLAWAILFTYPLVFHLAGSVVLSRGDDAYLHLWDLWWADKSLVGLHHNPYFTTYLYYPTGLNLFYHSLDIFNGILSIPLQHLFGLTASFNLLLLANLTLDGLAAYWLCIERTHSAGAALVGGILFASAPLLGTSINLGQLDEVTAWWIPLYILALWRALDSPGPFWRKEGGLGAAICAGLCLAGASLATWYFTAGLVIFTVLFVPAYLLSKQRSADRTATRAAWRQAATKVGLAIGVFVIILSPLLWSMIRERLSGATYMFPSPAATIENSADLAGLFLPARIEITAVSGHGSNVALGWVALGLGLLGLLRRWRISWPIGLALLGVTVMSLGPHLQMFGNDTHLRLPYALLDNVPFIGASRQPLRFLATAGICLSLLAAFGTAFLLNRAYNRAWRRAVLPALIALVAVELLGIPRTLSSANVPQAYTYLRDQKEPGAVMELPYALWQARAQLNQSIHEKPILGGYTSRHFPYPFIEGAPGVAQLAAGFPASLDEPDIITPTLAQTALPSLDYYGVRYITLHKSDLASGRFGRLAALLKNLYPQGPAYEDADVFIYETPTGPAQDSSTAALPLVGLGSGWHAVEENPTRRWTGSNPGDGNASVWIGVRPGATGSYTLTMQTFAYGKPRHLSLILNDKMLLKKEIGLAPESLTMDMGILATGNYLLHLNVDEPPDAPPGDRRTLSIGVTQLEVARTGP